ncbi:DegT/DnrJ/EryC1/StrS family aminotransferase [Halofilum ochraceum]|uniref:DegT/DnrJ/EryC1/StrS family aminotransferase n=1 Tax=Halofilum ochraceum TaxID=1611323 RepID=UPI00082B6C6F|nr:DegT/DnrJ/EryC1/StrS family aminotransferase [Halofilum ochraceum]
MASALGGVRDMRRDGVLTQNLVFGMFYRMPPVACPMGWSALLRSLGGRIRADEAYGFSTGQGALRWAFGVLAQASPERSTVILPAWTCWSVAAAVEYAGLRIALVDLDPATLDFEPAALAERVGPDTLAIVSTHLLGRRPDLTSHARLAAAAGAWLVEDAAQAQDPRAGPAPGVAVRMTSTARGKPLSTSGGGWLQVGLAGPVGAFARAWPNVPPAARGGEAIRAAKAVLVDGLLHPRAFWLPARLPFLGIGRTRWPDRIEVRAASRQQQRLYPVLAAGMDRLLAGRRIAALAYADALAGLPGPQPGGCDIPDYAPHRYPVMLTVPWLDAAPRVRARAAQAGVCGLYPRALSELEQVRALRVDGDAPMPGAERIARHLVTLPTHAGVGPRERERALASIGEFSP